MRSAQAARTSSSTPCRIASSIEATCAAWALARRRYRVLAHARHTGHLLTRTGVVHRRLTVVPESKIQWVGLTQSPFQRRLGIASATVATAAGAFGGMARFWLADLAVRRWGSNSTRGMLLVNASGSLLAGAAAGQEPARGQTFG